MRLVVGDGLGGFFRFFKGLLMFREVVWDYIFISKVCGSNYLFLLSS